MSNEALTWAFKLDLKTGAKFVLVSLADYADENHSCYPTFQQISDRTGMGVRAVSNHVSWLTDNGFISKTRTRNSHGNLGRYRFKLHMQNLHVGIIPSGKKRQSLAAKSAGHNPQYKPSIKDNTNVLSKKDDLAHRIFTGWNAMAKANGLTQVRLSSSNESRRKQIRIILKSCNGRKDDIFEAILNVPNNPHWLGKNERGWRADFDWVFKTNNFTRVLEFTEKQNEQITNNPSAIASNRLSRREKRIRANEAHRMAKEI